MHVMCDPGTLSKYYLTLKQCIIRNLRTYIGCDNLSLAIYVGILCILYYVIKIKISIEPIFQNHILFVPILTWG